jgi:hypothetical protein
VIGKGLTSGFEVIGVLRLPRIRVLTTLGFGLSLESGLLKLLLGKKLCFSNNGSEVRSVSDFEIW